MKRLFEKYYQKLDNTTPHFERSLLHNIDWTNRLIGIKGARGTGKTTMLLQHARTIDQPGKNNALYVSLDDFYFSANRLDEMADQFVKEGGHYLFLDEVHRYPDWAVTLKTLYDDHPKLKIVFTGSSLIHLESAKSDLSRRAVMYELFGLSFREYLNVTQGLELKSYTLEEILTNHQVLARQIISKVKPLAHFANYLRYGYYPYFMENEKMYHQKLSETLTVSLMHDLPAVYDIQYSSIEKVKLLLHILAESVPFKPNISKLSERIGVSRNSLIDFFRYLEEMRIIKRLFASTKGIGILQKPEKLFLYHPNLSFALSDEHSNTGALRESFFINQLSSMYSVSYSTIGDVFVRPYTFEIGGKSKSDKQVRQLKNAYIAADQIEIGHQHHVPLWLFGFLY